MAALMVPFGLKSFFGLYPESRRFLIYRARPLLLTPPGTGACANAGVAAIAASSTAAARVLNETMVVSPVSIGCRSAWDTTRSDHASRGERAVGTRAVDVGEIAPVPLNSDRGNQLRLKR